jgi:hypothetical protein
MVADRHEARLLVPTTSSGFTARPPIPYGNGAVARVLFDRLMKHMCRLTIKEIVV